MKPLSIILSLLCCWGGVKSQTLPSGIRRALDVRKDTVASRLGTYVPPTKTKGGLDMAAAKKTSDSVPAARRSPRLAETEMPPSDPPLILSLDHPSCKIIEFIAGPQDYDTVAVVKTIPPMPKAAEPAPHVPFLQIHGNVMYNLNYYSRIDTPYSEHDIYQHTIQTWLDILVKGQYPFRIFLTNHFSNSSVFRNFSDFNLGYNNAGFKQLIRDQIRREFLVSLPSQRKLDSLQKLLDQDWTKLRGLEGWIKNPALIQHEVEARERSLRPTKQDSIGGAGSLHSELDSVVLSRRAMADSLRKEIGLLQALLQHTHERSKTGVDRSLQDIQRMDNPAQLRKTLSDLGMSDSSLPKGYQTLMSIRSLSLGRSVVNYSELSAKNISINGVQAEYNPSTYYAFASGSVDYRFRDFIMQGPNQAKQYLNVFRVGKGLRDGNSVILTYFTGKRQLYNASTSDTSHTQVPSTSLMGLTLEGNYHIMKNVLLTGEIAKSSTPGYAGDSSGRNKHLFNMNDRSNEAWSVKTNAYFPATHTRIKAAYKHLAVNYQSFSIFTDGSAQSAWSASINQLFWKKQLDVTLGANTNDFSNPLLNQDYKSTTVFKSVQATLRKRYWPVISLGYFPSSQITKLGSQQYIENMFYTLVGNVTHSYTYGTVMMNTALVYTQFYNRSADSGFTYFNTRNMLLSQSIFLPILTLQLNASAATNTDYRLYMLEGKVQHNFGKLLTLGAGIKYNKQTTYDIDQLGYSAEAALRLAKFGQIQFSADKGFIPGMNKALVPDNTGRLTYYKTF